MIGLAPARRRIPAVDLARYAEPVDPGQPQPRLADRLAPRERARLPERPGPAVALEGGAAACLRRAVGRGLVIRPRVTVKYPWFLGARRPRLDRRGRLDRQPHRGPRRVRRLHQPGRLPVHRQPRLERPAVPLLLQADHARGRRLGRRQGASSARAACSPACASSAPAWSGAARAPRPPCTRVRGRPEARSGDRREFDVRQWPNLMYLMRCSRGLLASNGRRDARTVAASAFTSSHESIWSRNFGDVPNANSCFACRSITQTRKSPVLRRWVL